MFAPVPVPDKMYSLKFPAKFQSLIWILNKNIAILSDEEEQILADSQILNKVCDQG